MNTHIDPFDQHAEWSPSSSHRWIPCTASAEGIAKLPKQEEGEAAKEGTAAHEELERVLTGGTPDPTHPGAYAVALAMDFIKQLPPGQTWIEQRVQLTPQIWGRCDFAHWELSTNVLTILDLKNGSVNVDAENNEQLMIYAAASIYTHDLSTVKWVRLVVVQPNSFIPGPRVKQAWVSASDLFAFAIKVAAIPTGPLEFKAGEHCKYCPLFGRCPASADVLTKLGVAMAHAPADVPADQWAIFKACEKPIADWFKAGDKAKLKEALTGKIPAGMKVVQTVTRRTWKDEAAAREYVVERFGVNSLDPPTPLQVEKLGATTSDIASLVHKPEGGPTLAFESDPRPTWQRRSAAEMFAGVKAPAA